jgi:hypothetical protein
MSKYLTKDLFAAVPSKKKRISTSRGIRLFQKRQPLGLSMDFRSVTSHFRNYSDGRRRIVSDVIYDEAGLKSFKVSSGVAGPTFVDGRITFP